MSAATAAVRTCSDEELRAAWIRIHRASWPATFEQAMEDPLLSRMVTLAAKHPPRARVVPFDRKPRPADWHSIALPGFAPGHVDVKRLAAGDRDDD